jgi:electron transfer flavoprotein alpha subunit
MFMEKILMIAAVESDGSIGKAALEALAAAQTLKAGLGGAELSIGFIGADVQQAADAVAACGATRFLGVANPELAQGRYASDAAAAEALVKAAAPTIVLAPATSRMQRFLSGVAQRAGGVIDTHATDVAVEAGAPAVTRWYYRQRMTGLIKRTARPWFITVDPGSLAPASTAPGKASVEAVAASWTSKTKVTGVKSPSSGAQTIRPEAAVLLVAGAGWCKKQADGVTHVPEAETLILGFLEKSQASLGGSKSLVDQSGDGTAVLQFMTHLNQVGQTGATPRHPKGLATCCHGEEPHVVGWRFINERRAVNLNASCGWAQGKADVLYVADAFQLMKRVNELL